MTLLGKNKIILHCFHGFLGQASDWDFIQSFNDLGGISLNVVKYSLLSENKYIRANRLPELASLILAEIKQKNTEKEKHILLGYSLGGRVALHIMHQEPELFQSVICISTHPGLESEKAKLERIDNDMKWAEKFKKLSWNELMNEWNNQQVFQSSSVKQKDESDFDREKLALALVNWSLGQQECFTPTIASNSDKIVWVYGEQDRKFKEIALNLKQKIPSLKVIEVHGAGHRVLNDHPETIRDIIKDLLLEKIKKG